MKAIEKGNKSKLSVTVEPSLARAVERQARRLRVPKSRIVADAIRLWESHRRAALAREGYMAMATEDRDDAVAYVHAVEDVEDE